MLIVNRELRIPQEELHFSFARSSGPGGQNVNKVNSKALLRFQVLASPSLPPAVRDRLLRRHASRITSEGDLLLTSQRYRDQSRNVEDCLEKLRTMLLAAATPPKTRKPTKPSRGSIHRRLEAKRDRSRTKETRRPPSDRD